MTEDWRTLNEETRTVWNQNAAFWDEHMGEGNDFQKLLIEPATDRLLGPCAGMRVLEIGCGNGLYARHLAGLGVEVLATDFSEGMLDHARARTTMPLITYQQLDATDAVGLAALGGGRFDAVVSNMAIMDIANVEPLFAAVPRLLAPGGCLVFTVLHPCFNAADTVLVSECFDPGDGTLHTVDSVKISSYVGRPLRKGLAIEGQPATQWYFERTLTELFGLGFAAGLVVDGLDEPTFPPDLDRVGGRPNWGRVLGIPPVIAVRMRPTP